MQRLVKAWSLLTFCGTPSTVLPRKICLKILSRDFCVNENIFIYRTKFRDYISGRPLVISNSNELKVRSNLVIQITGSERIKELLHAWYQQLICGRH